LSQIGIVKLIELMDSVVLFRPVGEAELALIRDSGWSAFPPRLATQPIFYPVLEEDYAIQIARDWNTRDGARGFVLRFRVDQKYLSRYAVQTVGARVHREYWIPAEDLGEFNRNIVGNIDVIHSFGGGDFSKGRVTMTREEFTSFVEKTVEEVICLAEQKSGKQLPRTFAFQWFGQSQPLITENVIEHIVRRVFVDEEHIYPCVDIGVGDLLEDGSPLIVGSVAGYAPREFGENWTGRRGPFIHIIGAPFLNRIAGRPTPLSPDGIFSYSIPDMKNLE
jgi:hypothetical protein